MLAVNRKGLGFVPGIRIARISAGIGIPANRPALSLRQGEDSSPGNGNRTAGRIHPMMLTAIDIQGLSATHEQSMGSRK